MTGVSRRQLDVLIAVCETLLPEFPPSTADRLEQLIAGLTPGDRGRLGLLLSLLDSRAVNLMLSGRPQSFVALAIPEREAVLRGWANSRLELRRAGFQALKRL